MNAGMLQNGMKPNKKMLLITTRIELQLHIRAS